VLEKRERDQLRYESIVSTPISEAETMVKTGVSTEFPFRAKVKHSKEKNSIEQESTLPLSPSKQEGRAAGQDPEEEPSGEQRAKTPFKSPTQQALFDTFWEQYPKKRSKGAAEKAWLKINPDQILFERMMASLAQAKGSRDWTKDDGQFVPYPATWLAAKGWDDDYREAPKQAHLGRIKPEASPAGGKYDEFEAIRRRLERQKGGQALESAWK